MSLPLVGNATQMLIFIRQILQTPQAGLPSAVNIAWQPSLCEGNEAPSSKSCHLQLANPIPIPNDSLQDIIPSNNTFFKHFLDLLSKIFVYDPAQRITAKQALNHPWFREIAHPDDGTEAAKIRLENEEKARQAQYVG